MALDPSDNWICNVNFHGRGKYSNLGVMAFLDVIKARKSITSIDLSCNCLCGVYYQGLDPKGDFASEALDSLAEVIGEADNLTYLNVSGTAELGNRYSSESYSWMHVCLLGIGTSLLRFTVLFRTLLYLNVLLALLPLYAWRKRVAMGGNCYGIELCTPV